MNYRTKLGLAFLCVALTPVIATGLLVRHETTRWLTAQFDERARAVSASVTDALALESERIDEVLDAVSRDAQADNELRVAVVLGDTVAGYLVDYAPRVMRRTPLEVLMLVGDDGNLLSSGHFRNDFGRDLEGLPAALPSDGAAALLRVRTPDGQLIALVRATRFAIGDRMMMLVGGIRMDSTYLRGLSTDPELTVRVSGLPLDARDDGLSSLSAVDAGGVSFRSAVPFVDVAGPDVSVGGVWLEVTHDTSPLDELLADLNRWFLVLLAAAAIGALVAALYVADRMSRPLTELADRAARIDMNRSGDLFLSRRNDEIGQLSRRLADMVKRLRESAGSLRAAERRATLGDMARQVNHDVRNGLTPIKNVVRHLSEISEEEPSAVGDVFVERRRTLESSIAYLEELASRYAKLSPQTRREACDLASLARQVVEDFRASGLGGAGLRGKVTFQGMGPVPIDGDPVALRRLVENLIRNALESREDQPVNVTVRVAGASSAEGSTLTVTDDGPGIAEETRRHMFDDFYTTKATGTGLGLSIVRRVALDHNAKIAVTGGPGAGTTFTIEFPK